MHRFRQLLQLARRYPFCGFCAAISVILAIASPLLWLRAHSLGAIQQKRQAEGEAVQATLISAAQLRQEIAFVKQTMQRITDNLANEDSLVANTDYFLEMAERCGVELKLRPFNSPPPETGADYKRIPFNLRISGSFPQLAKFIHAVETGPRLSAINSFAFRRTADGSVVDLDFNVDLLGKR